MLLARARDLPTSLPHPRAIASWGGGLHNYEPEFWELEYQTYRYLSRVTDGELEKRYGSILRNIEALVTTDRDIIPIESFLSSWYWFRKEHQTRLEMLLRGAAVSVPILRLRSPDRKSIPRSKWPNAGDVLFRYGRHEHLEPLLLRGELRMFRASKQKDRPGDAARFDDECEKRSYMPGQYTRISTVDGRDIPVNGDVRRAVVGPDYYMLCMSCDWDETLLNSFSDVDACLIITDVDNFMNRLEAAAAKKLPGWVFHHNPVEYFDPYELPANTRLDSAMSKDFRFAYQREYRVLVFPLHGETTGKFVDLPPLGSLNGIADLRSSGSHVPV
jgi:hypothetical protein